MTQSYNFAQLQEEAKAEGFSNELIPDGTYTMEAVNVNVSSSQGGKDQIGVRWKILEGPSAGESGWDNQTISPENGKAMGFFFRFCAQFGMDATFFQRQPQPTLAEIATIIEGTIATVKVGNRTWKQRPGAQGDPKRTNTFAVVPQTLQTGLLTAPPPAAPQTAVQAPLTTPQTLPAPPSVAAPIDPATGLPARSF